MRTCGIDPSHVVFTSEAFMGLCMIRLKTGSAPVLPPSSERLVAKNKDGYDLSVPLREGGQDGKSIVLYSPRIARTAHISLYVYEE
jgi:hypothetical protein